MRHWASDYVGKKWAAGGRGPSVFDCWGLVVWLRKHQYDPALGCPEFAIDPKDMPKVTSAFTEAEQSTDWIHLDVPFDGCLVVMSQNKVFHHVGLYLDVDGGVVLHARDGFGVLCQRANTLINQGWRRVEYYAHKTWMPKDQPS